MGTSFFSSQLLEIDLLTGEQSVGKSYSLNHLVDTSFAGSAMRTTGLSILGHDDCSKYNHNSDYRGCMDVCHPN